RDIAQRFNAIYGDVFKIPEGLLSKSGAKVMSLQEPTKKMSKSDENPKAYISMMDDMNVIAKKIRSTVTDSEGVIEYREGDETKAGVNNLLSIMSAVTGRGIDDIVNDYSGKGYGDFKNDVAEAVVECIRPIRTEYDKLIKDKAYLTDICTRGAENTKRIADRTLKKVYKKVGFVI
ncbi:MAG: tryptophan--tRNA ligase, partial [Oscillospiraceae bacterium]|nr:tryptophan--tRNA ligase [Oscillospiraceae bacterium]